MKHEPLNGELYSELIFILRAQMRQQLGGPLKIKLIRGLMDRLYNRTWVTMGGQLKSQIRVEPNEEDE